MKKLLVLLFSLLRNRKPIQDPADEIAWENLDGAEFFVVPPASRSLSAADQV